MRVSVTRRQPAGSARRTADPLNLGYWLGADPAPGYTRLSQSPEVMTCVNRIASLISSMTIYLMENSKGGDVRLRDRLATFVDVSPWQIGGTRKVWVDWIVRQLLAGDDDGNAYVLPVTKAGELSDLAPMPGAHGVSSDNGASYRIEWRGRCFDPDEVLHFRLFSDAREPWRGCGYRVLAREIAESLHQANETKRKFMESEYMPPVIVSVDTDSDLSNDELRERYLNRYIGAERGKPWLIPAGMMSVQQVKPLTLNDLAIRDTLELDKRAIAAIFGLPAYALGVGAFNADEHNNMVKTVVMPICQSIAQEMTSKLVISPKRYFTFNPRSLYAYDLQQLSAVADDQFVRGIMTGNEVRDWLGLSPLDGLDELTLLENYIPLGKLADQKKLVQNGQEEES